MTKDEAMQMAFDALLSTGLQWPDIMKAIEALRTALANHCERCGKKLGTEVTDIHTCTPKEIAVWEALIESVRQMRDVQGMDGNWNYDPYMHGLFNGIEFSLSLIEVREPKFRDAPEKWLCDQPKARIFSGEKSK